MVPPRNGLSLGNFSRVAIPSSLFLLFLFTPAAFGQESTFASDDQGASSTSVVTTPEQMRRVSAPKPDATPQQLEDQGDVLRAQKFFADSLDRYHEALKKGGNGSILHNKIGICELSLLHYDLARKEFEAAAKQNKDYSEAYNNLGVVHYIDRNYRRAISYYKHAIKLDENSASFHSNLGSAYFARKKFPEANQEYSAALRIDPLIFERRSGSGVAARLPSPADRAHYFYVVAKMYAKVGDLDHCLVYLRRSMEEGYAVLVNVQKDGEFTPFRKDPRFLAVMEKPPVAISQ